MRKLHTSSAAAVILPQERPITFGRNLNGECWVDIGGLGRAHLPPEKYVNMAITMLKVAGVSVHHHEMEASGLGLKS